MVGTRTRRQQQTAQLLLHLIIAQGLSPLFSHNHQVARGQKALMTPEKFPQQALHAVAPDRLAETPGHHQSQAGARGGGRGQDDPEMARMQPPPLGLDPEKIAATAEMIRFGETGGPCDG